MRRTPETLFCGAVFRTELASQAFWRIHEPIHRVVSNQKILMPLIAGVILAPFDATKEFFEPLGQPLDPENKLTFAFAPLLLDGGRRLILRPRRAGRRHVFWAFRLLK
jgi:hypothetical protein